MDGSGWGDRHYWVDLQLRSPRGARGGAAACDSSISSTDIIVNKVTSRSGIAVSFSCMFLDKRLEKSDASAACQLKFVFFFFFFFVG